MSVSRSVPVHVPLAQGDLVQRSFLYEIALPGESLSALAVVVRDDRSGDTAVLSSKLPAS